MQHAMRAFGLNLKRWAEDYPGAMVVVGVILASGAFFGLLAIAHGCETKALGEEKETMGGCGVPASQKQGALGIPKANPGKGQDRRREPMNRSNSGQPPISLQAVAPAEGLPNASGANVLGGPRLFFDVLFAHESVGGTILVGDKGKSRGPYHIQRVYWQDGGGDPKAYDRLVDDRAACEKVMLAYFRRYEPEALAQGDFETLARLHNGGPTWRKKPVTRAYWRKVKAHL